MKTFGKYLEEKNKGLWDNIHAKRKRGEKMRKPGSKGAPTDADFKRSQEESVEEKKLTAAELKKREEIAKAMERDNPGMDMSKKMAIATATAKRVAEEQKLDEISQKKKDDYVAKASADRQSAWVKKGMADRTKDTKTSDAMKKKMAKRDKGMYRAMGEQNLDEKVYASDYNVDAEKSKFGGYTPVVTHKKTGRTMYSAQHSYKKPEHAKGHASAYLNGYQAMGDRHADRKAREYATQNQKHQYVKESLDISEISLDMLTKKISNSGMDTTKKANKMDKTKNDLAALRAKLAGKPAMAKESVELDEAVHTVEIDHDGDQDHDAFKHKITLKHSSGAGGTTATGKKKDLQKYLAKHYVSRSDAKDTHPEVFESVELDELSKKTLGSYIKKADKQADKAADSYSNAAMRRSDFAPDTPAMAKNAKKFAKRDAGADLARRKLAKEATELDELNKKTLGSYIKKASRDVANRSADNARDVAKNGAKPGLNKKTMKNWRREIGIDMAIDKMTKEATELDELNKKTLGSYIKKASGSAAGVAAVTSAQAAIKGKSNPDDRRQLRNRLTGISRATDKVTKEEVANEAVSNNMRLISKIKNSGVVKTGSMAKDTKPAPKKEVDEAKRKGAPKMTGDSVAIQRAKDAALNKALGRTKTGRKKPERTMTSTQRSLASLRKEGVMSADKKAEKFIKPDGSVGIRMVRVDKEVIKKD